MQLRWILSTVLFLGAVQTRAAESAAPKKALNAEQQAKIEAYNRELSRRTQPMFDSGSQPARPYSEVEDAGYFFISSGEDFRSSEAKKTMIKNLPSTVTAVVYTSPGNDKQRIMDRYKDLIPADRLKVIELSGANRGFWARDGLPVAAWSQKGGEIQFVDARYYHGFEPDAQLASMFHTTVSKHSYYYEGGNFMVNDLGDCILVNNQTARTIPDSIFTGNYGCKQIHRMPFEKGIGHIDETVRFIRSKTVVTDSSQYAATLRDKGFEVVMLPRPEEEVETYVNALLVNDTIFVPVFGQSTDAEAVKVYESFGLKVVPINTSVLSNDGLGSLHCITMTYPKVPFQVLLSRLNAREL